MTNPYAEHWRNIGDTTLAVFEAELAQSPMLPHAKSIYEAAKPHTAMFLAHSRIENQHATTGKVIQPEHHNPLSLVARYGEPRIPYPDAPTMHNRFAIYATWEDCVAAWKRRHDDPTMAYKDTKTLKEYLAIYAPDDDVHEVTGVPNADIHYYEKFVSLLKGFATMEVTFGRVPHPAFSDRLILNKSTGWSNLGVRTPRGAVLHRMWGNLWGTDNYFRDPTVKALTDYGVGTANVDGAANDGKILRWTDPRGTISGWASGPVSAPYGDGLLFVNRYGEVAVNKDLVSIEISGQDVAVSDAAFESVCQLIAYYADQYKVPYFDFPYIKAEDNRSFVIWHQEFTIGTGKTCPFTVVMNLTNAIIARVKDILTTYQNYVAPPPPTPAVFVFDPKVVWPEQTTGPVGRRWEQEGRTRHSWGVPTATWNVPDGAGGKLYLFSDGLLVRAYEENGIWKTDVL